MKEVILIPQVSYFETCAEFAKEFQLGSDDLILTNEYIFNPYFGNMNLDVHTIFQEKYGAGEPTDIMVDAILEEAAKTGCKRIIAIGGGTVIDIAKVMAVSAGDPLGGTYHVAHGESNYAMFTAVLKNYMEIKQDGEIAFLNQKLAGLLGCDVAEAYDKLDELLGALIPKKALHEYGMKEEELEIFTKSVMEQQGRLMANNFIPLDAARVLKIYTECF